MTMIIAVSLLQSSRSVRSKEIAEATFSELAGFTDLLAPRLRRSPSPESSANLLLDFSHLTDQMNFSNLLGRGNVPQRTNSNGTHQQAFATAGPSHIAPPAPPPPPPPPPLPMYNFQPASMQESGTPTTGPSNFNAGFDFDSTYGVASSNYDTPFLSASEANWLFNHASLQFDTPMPAASSTSSALPGSAPAAATAQPPPSLPVSTYEHNQHSLRNSAIHFHQETVSPRGPSQFPQTTDSRSGTSSNAPSRNQSFSLTPTSAVFPSSLNTILNPAHQRRNRHVRFADGQASQPSQSPNRQSFGADFHPPLAPPSNAFQDNSNQSFGGDFSQASAPRTIKISLPTRNRLAKHLAVRCISLIQI